MAGRLDGKRVLVTDADRYMGPPIVELFRGEGAEVLADQSDLDSPDAADDLVARSGHTSATTCTTPTRC